MSSQISSKVEEVYQSRYDKAESSRKTMTETKKVQAQIRSSKYLLTWELCNAINKKDCNNKNTRLTVSEGK